MYASQAAQASFTVEEAQNFPLPWVTKLFNMGSLSLGNNLNVAITGQNPFSVCGGRLTLINISASTKESANASEPLKFL
jgi:hypothetical protein